VGKLITIGQRQTLSGIDIETQPRWPAFRSLLLAAVLVPLSILAIGAWVAWGQVWRQAEAELARTADAAAEYAARLLEGHLLLADRVDDLIRGLTDEEVRAREAELHASLRHMAVTRPWLLTLYAIDAEGRPLVSANVFPVPHDADLQDRDFFQALRDQTVPASSYVSKIHVGRFDGQLFFSVAERRGQAETPDAGAQRVPGHTVAAPFRGVVLASLRPNELAAELRRLSGQPEDVVALVRRDGELLARSTGFDRPPPPLSASSPMMPTMAAGAERAIARGRSSIDGAERVAAYRRVEGWPVYASVARSKAAIMARWRETVALQVGFGLPAILGLMILVGSVSRRSREVAEAREALRSEAARREAAEALRDSEERLRLAQEAGGVGTWEWDPVRGVAVCSEAYCRLYGLDPKGPGHESVEAWLAQVHPDDRDHAQSMRSATLTAGRLENEYRIVRPDGSVRWVMDRGVPVYDAEGRLIRLLGANVDITETREAAERLRELQSQVLHASRLSAMGQMAAALAHELNQPLGAATNFLNAARIALGSGTPDGVERAMARLDRAAEQTVRAGAILRRLRDFVTRRDADKRVVNARRLVEDAVALALVGKRDPDLRVRLDFDPSDPSILADGIQIQQVVFNLVRNALEAMDGRQHRAIVVATKVMGPEVEISVADSGPGLPEDPEILFKPFATSKPTGMGIGLSICRTIVEAHGGHLRAEPRSGGGAMFRFTVPGIPPREAIDAEREHHSRGG
jgi:PAS domain S-box-containing protein